MPFIKTKVNIPLTQGQEEKLKHRMGQAISLIPGKTEEYLLLEFEDNCLLWLGGKSEYPIAYIEAAIFGNEAHYGYDTFTKKIAEIISDVLHIGTEHIYIKFEDIPVWSVGTFCIDRNKYR